jgi:hypothetical protein
VKPSGLLRVHALNWSEATSSEPIVFSLRSGLWQAINRSLWFAMNENKKND